jgi:hypothetical protein
MDKDLISTVSPEQWSASGGLPGLVIWALFLVIALMMWMLEKKLTRVADETAKLTMAIERARNSIVEKLYEAGVLDDRRRRREGVAVERRQKQADQPDRES